MTKDIYIIKFGLSTSQYLCLALKVNYCKTKTFAQRKGMRLAKTEIRRVYSSLLTYKASTTSAFHNVCCLQSIQNAKRDAMIHIQQQKGCKQVA